MSGMNLKSDVNEFWWYLATLIALIIGLAIGGYWLTTYNAKRMEVLTTSGYEQQTLPGESGVYWVKPGGVKAEGLPE